LTRTGFMFSLHCVVRNKIEMHATGLKCLHWEVPQKMVPMLFGLVSHADTTLTSIWWNWQHSRPAVFLPMQDSGRNDTPLQSVAFLRTMSVLKVHRENCKRTDDCPFNPCGSNRQQTREKSNWLHFSRRSESVVIQEQCSV
jgi:hypothetical protein